jgi:hypothetical protein
MNWLKQAVVRKIMNTKIKLIGQLTDSSWKLFQSTKLPCELETAREKINEQYTKTDYNTET